MSSKPVCGPHANVHNNRLQKVRLFKSLNPSGKGLYQSPAAGLDAQGITSPPIKMLTPWLDESSS